MHGVRFLGYAMVFDRPYDDGDVFSSGCLDGFLKEPNHLTIPILNGHIPTEVLGRWIHMEIDNFGLKVIGQLSVPMPYKDVHNMGLSIGPIDGKGPPEKNAYGGKTVNIVRLAEISLLTQPCHSSCRVIMEMPFGSL